jgi:acetyl-CoA synthetase
MGHKKILGFYGLKVGHGWPPELHNDEQTFLEDTEMDTRTKSFAFADSVVWRPTAAQIAASRIEAFRRQTGEASMDSLRARAAADPNWFWREVCRDLAIDFAAPPQDFFRATRDPSRPEWCVGGQMNIVTSCLDKWQQLGRSNAVALRYESEDGAIINLTYDDLLDRVRRVTAWLRTINVTPGCVVAIMMPMNPDAVVALLAVARCGAIALPLFSGFGRSAIAIRLQESGAAVVLCSESMQRRGKSVPFLEPLKEALVDCPMVQHVVVAQTTDGAQSATPDGRLGSDTSVAWWSWATALAATLDGDAGEASIVPCEQPVLLMFTSGTTGKPKGAVHTHCGFPIKAAQDMRHAMDLGPSDTLHWVSDLGWMMGPWAIFGSLLGGMTLALYDGAPDYPDASRLLRFVKKHSVTFLGISPPLARLLKASDVDKTTWPDLTTSLRAIGSTGSPWDRESWMWTFQHLLTSNRPIINYSGGTEISGGILCGDWLTPLKPCSFSAPVLGMEAAVVDTTGQSVRGQPGELIIRNPWIGMTRGFWNNDPRYQTSYWTRFPGLWTHGDLAVMDTDGLWYLVGRSDDTIKVAGKRLGPAEVESILNACPAVRESAAIGVPDPAKGEALVVFCVLANQGDGLESVRKTLRETVAMELGKPLTPREVWFVRSLPRTRNAKTMHRVIKALYEGAEPGEVSALENPQALDDVRSRF